MYESFCHSVTELREMSRDLQFNLYDALPSNLEQGRESNRARLTPHSSTPTDAKKQRASKRASESKERERIESERERERERRGRRG